MPHRTARTYIETGRPSSWNSAAPPGNPYHRDSHRPPAPLTTPRCDVPALLKYKNIWIPAVLGALAAVAVLFATAGGDGDDETADDTTTESAAGSAGRPIDAELLVRDSSHRLTQPTESKATFVEFLDFECEGCGAAYPAIEELRGTYGDRVTFVVRYFPLDGHFNADRAARAVEAAAQQGEFERMYQKMFDTQRDWGEQQVPADDTFRGFAEELSLDMVAWDAAYNDPATIERIRVDQADGRALGVESTPSFFLDGKQLVPQSFEDLVSAFEAAVE